MSRIPASLLYLTVYNPSIKPVLQDTNDEDAEEQAQILFYTARERAVSRDRMLRQVGLAKALVNFTEMFSSAGEPCQNVHSQTRRMVMVSPEPDFWIHACVELPKTPRAPASKGKKQEKGKVQEVVYDYHDGAIYDTVLKAHLLRGYEKFKLTHGSFTSIMANLGQQALELQLERFFTVWAWMWDIEDEIEFGDHLGIPLHPCYKLLTSHFDSLTSLIPPEAIPILLAPPCLIPSPRFTELNSPVSLVRHLLTLVPTHSVVRLANAGSSTLKPSATGPNNVAKELVVGEPHTGGFLTMPNVSMPAMPSVNLNMDVRKWTWPGYLTFGKGVNAEKLSKPVGDPGQTVDAVNGVQEGVDTKANMSVGVDPRSLEEAMTNAVNSDGDPVQIVVPPEHELSSRGDMPSSAILLDAAQINEEPDPTSGNLSTPSSANSGSIPWRSNSPVMPEDPPFVLSRSYVHLADVNDPIITQKRQVFYLTKDDMTFALVDGYNSCIGDENLSVLTENVIELIEKVVKVISEEEHRSGSETPITAAKILQPKDSYIFSLGNVTLPSSEGFNSTSEHLYNGQQLLQSDCDVVEVFSRGQNPQHWHVSRRGLGLDKDGNTARGEVYLESARKESSLADVDNEIAGAVRRLSK